MIDAAYSIRHNLWATRKLLLHAQDLSPAELALTVPGTAGSVKFCLAHIVGADQRYLVGLGVEIDPQFRESDDSELDLLLQVHGENERRWERLLAEAPDISGWYQRPGGEWRVRPFVLPAQAIHHGTDHRTQVGTILLNHGLALPDLDVWTYAAELGDYTEVEPGPSA